jgi:hypothetical protein
MSRTGLGVTALVCLWAAALAASPAGASVITLGFSGSIVDVQDPTRIGDGSIVVGTPFAGSFTFDTAIREQEGLGPDPSRSFFVPGEEGSPFEFSVRIGQQSFLANLDRNFDGDVGFSFDVLDGPSAGTGENFDRFTVGASFAGRGFQFFEAGATQIQLALLAPSGQAISSTSLAQIPFDLAAFPDAQLFFRMDDQFTARGRVDRLAVVPEPGVAGLIALGLAQLARRRRR